MTGRFHDCLDFIDLRFHGADDLDGTLTCMFRGCGATYTEAELSTMHEDQLREPMVRRAAA